MNYIIRGIPAAFVPKLWPHCEAFVKRALDHANGEITHRDVLEFCEDRAMQLWCVSEGNKIVGAVTTEIVNYRQKKVCRVITLSGKDFDVWSRDLDRLLLEWAGEQGCVGVEACVRRGFVKKLGALGYKEKYDLVYKAIGEEHHG